MATCDRECETCQYGRTCPISCRYINIVKRSGPKHTYHDMNDGKVTFIQYGHVATCTGLFNLSRAWKYNKDDNGRTAVEIWESIADQEAD